jgi:hypothetical protein
VRSCYLAAGRGLLDRGVASEVQILNNAWMYI